MSPTAPIAATPFAAKNAQRAGARPTGRALERRLLIWLMPVVLLGIFATSRSPGVVQPTLIEAARAFGIVYGACLALHALFSLARFDGDPLLLPLLALLFLLGTAYHIGLLRPGGGSSIGIYLTTVVVGVAVIGGVVLLVPWLRRLGLLFEERVWWRVAGDLPYYESAPFHLVLFGLMLLL